MSREIYIGPRGPWLSQHNVSTTPGGLCGRIDGNIRQDPLVSLGPYLGPNLCIVHNRFPKIAELFHVAWWGQAVPNRQQAVRVNVTTLTLCCVRLRLGTHPSFTGTSLFLAVPLHMRGGRGQGVKSPCAQVFDDLSQVFPFRGVFTSFY